MNSGHRVILAALNASERGEAFALEIVAMSSGLLSKAGIYPRMIRLVDLGFVTRRTELARRVDGFELRPRTIYTITDAGRAALAKMVADDEASR